MAVEYHASKVTNMDMDNSNVAYKQFFTDGSKFQYSVCALRKSPFRVATVCLGLLCVLLLAGVIGQSVHYQKVEQDHQKHLQAMSKDKDILQENLKTEQNEKKNLAASRDRLQLNYDFLSKRKDQIQTNNNLLGQEANTLRLSQSQLQASNADLKREKDQLNANKELLQTNNNALSKANTLLQGKYDSVVTLKKELQASFDSVIRERDNLQNILNNVTRSKEQLQMTYNTLIKDVEHLQDRYNFSSSEKDKLESSHQNLTISRDTLQAANTILKNALDKEQAAYTSLVQEKHQLEMSWKNATLERDLLKIKNDNLTAERDKLQVEIEKLSRTIQSKKCPTGWAKFENSCYFTSVGKKSWSLGRQDCINRGADLAIIKTREEMNFIDGLYIGDKEVWIGLTDLGVEGHWMWVDGTPLSNTTFWGKNQPNSYDGRNQDCVEFWHHKTREGDWNDESCNVEQIWICEM